MRTLINFNTDWFFTKNQLDEESLVTIRKNKMDKVTLPHTWNKLDGQDGNNDFYRGECTYQKEFTLDRLFSDRKIFIEFGAVNSVCEVFLNGKRVGRHEGGYSAFRFEITRFISWKESNLITVKADNSPNRFVYPLEADFTFYGGIYRDVTIIAVEGTHFDLLDHGAEGIYVTPEVRGDSADITIHAKIVNPGQSEAVYEIFDSNSNHTTGIAVEARTDKMVLTIEKPHLWNGCEDPWLYTLVARLKNREEVLDELRIPFGIRTFKVDPEEGFFLNGSKYALNGVSRHQDREDAGWAITEKEQKEDLDLIREVGASSIRLAHYQHSQYFYNLCDEYGFVVWAEIPFISFMSEEAQASQNARSQLTELVKQNYNHPSICFWGIQNEVAIGGESEELYENVRDLNRLAKQLDPTRLTTSANLLYVEHKSALNRITDVVSYNLYFGWYDREINDFDHWLESFHKENPQVPIGISEYGCEANIDFHTDHPVKEDYSEEFQTYYHEKVWEIFSKKPFLWSTYVWNMFDFGSDRRDEGGVKGRNNKGLVTYDRRIRKDSFYFYKAMWSKEKFVHFNSKRFARRAGETAKIVITSNCQQILLFVNGKEIACRESHSGVFIFEEVKLEMGDNFLRAVSTCGCRDDMKITRVESPNPNYVYIHQNPGRNRTIHWFNAGKTAEQIFPEGYYSVRDKLGDLFDCPETMKIITDHADGIFRDPRTKTARGFTLERVLVLSGCSEETIMDINSKITFIKK